MLDIALILFAVAAVGGIAMAALHFRGRTPPPVALAVLHGIFAASGLVALFLLMLKAGLSGTPAIALGLLLVAALGGFGLLSFHIRGRALPNGLLIGHALLAVAGFVTLLAAALVVR